MYAWIWRHLPGGTGVRAGTAVLLVLAVAALLLFVVFPAVSEHVQVWQPSL
ncbi:hypothetical protein [Geodermatophilus marinus]|uniref:hypothetical protein n=1 Tax=Geodermatophilus sp. LHW52908 TaxID=2303986 RepID=UPI0018F4681A|nr:hypothetical protein [Geodermatophilus sp. LHW52908]